MLYVTTRNKYDTYTVYRANQADRGPDGGLYQPFRLPKLGNEEILNLSNQTFCQRMAMVINLFFGTKLTAWDVELCAGKNPVKLVPMSHRIVLAETWHNHDFDFAQLTNRLSACICGQEANASKSTSWMEIAIRIAILFATYGELLSVKATEMHTTIDVTVPTGDFAAPMAVWYAREMGLPIGNIVCSHEDSAVWDLIHHGQVRTEDRMPKNLERLICASLGVEENLRYCDVCATGRVYTVTPDALKILRQGIYATVISQERVCALIPSVYRMAGYIMGPETATAYGGLQDYRAKTGENGLMLLISDKSAIVDIKKVASYMDMAEQEIQEKVGV